MPPQLQALLDRSGFSQLELCTEEPVGEVHLGSGLTLVGISLLCHAGHLQQAYTVSAGCVLPQHSGRVQSHAWQFSSSAAGCLRRCVKAKVTVQTPDPLWIHTLRRGDQGLDD